jgi:hypothetical protein
MDAGRVARLVPPIATSWLPNKFHLISLAAVGIYLLL